MAYDKKKGGFPSLMLSATPGIDGTQIGLPDSIANPSIPAVAQAKPSAWGQGGKAWKILGIIGDGLQVAGGGQATYMPAMLDLERQVDAERKWQAQLDQQMQIAQARLAKGPNPTQLQLNYEYAKQQMPGLSFAKFMEMYHPAMFGGPDGQYQMQQPDGGEGDRDLTPEEIQKLGLPMGGPTQSASGGFR